jgi:hypothetical protein
MEMTFRTIWTTTSATVYVIYDYTLLHECAIQINTLYLSLIVEMALITTIGIKRNLKIND